MELEFSGVVFEWRGPAPHHFVRVPEAEAELIEQIKAERAAERAAVRAASANAPWPLRCLGL